MADVEIIQGEDRLKFFRELEEDGTLIRMSLSGKNFDRLTIITGTVEKNKVSFFVIDPPQGFKEALAGGEVRGMEFEFVSRDKIGYFFNCSKWKISSKRILIKFPDVIERKQRRRNFRLEAPPGTKLHFMLNSVRHEMSVSNVSMGGAFGPLVYFEKDTKQIPCLKIGEIFKKLELKFPSKEGTLKVTIKEAEVRRIEDDSKEGQNCCGIQFTDIKKSEENSLVEFIYRFQRQYLRERLPA